MIELTDADILARLKDTEDSTVERKTAADYRDCLKTAVGFVPESTCVIGIESRQRLRSGESDDHSDGYLEWARASNRGFGGRFHSEPESEAAMGQ